MKVGLPILLLTFKHLVTKKSELSLTLSTLSIIFRIFEESGFKVKEPYKNIGKGRIIAEAGKPCIIVCRLLHHIPNNLIFPPDINIQQTI
jgi:hypothetical protein